MWVSIVAEVSGESLFWGSCVVVGRREYLLAVLLRAMVLLVLVLPLALARALAPPVLLRPLGEMARVEVTAVVGLRAEPLQLHRGVFLVVV